MIDGSVLVGKSVQLKIKSLRVVHLITEKYLFRICCLEVLGLRGNDVDIHDL